MTLIPGPCHDDSANCTAWASAGECGKNPNYMNYHCQKSCDTCQGKYLIVIIGIVLVIIGIVLVIISIVLVIIGIVLVIIAIFLLIIGK